MHCRCEQMVLGGEGEEDGDGHAHAWVCCWQKDLGLVDLWSAATVALRDADQLLDHSWQFLLEHGTDED